jgi:hypothetical protein
MKDSPSRDQSHLREILVRKIVTDGTFIPIFQGIGRFGFGPKMPETKMPHCVSECARTAIAF